MASSANTCRKVSAANTVHSRNTHIRAAASKYQASNYPDIKPSGQCRLHHPGRNIIPFAFRLWSGGRDCLRAVDLAGLMTGCRASCISVRRKRLRPFLNNICSTSPRGRGSGHLAWNAEFEGVCLSPSRVSSFNFSTEVTELGRVITYIKRKHTRTSSQPNLAAQKRNLPILRSRLLHRRRRCELQKRRKSGFRDRC